MASHDARLRRRRSVRQHARGVLPEPVAPDRALDQHHRRDALVVADDYLALSPKPLSVIETFYEPDGGAYERRTYDVAWSPGAGGTPPYHATYTFRGFGGQEVFSQQPDSPVRLQTLDGQGRVASVRHVLPNAFAGGEPFAYEIERADHVYDLSGNQVESIRWERIPSAPGDTLGPANAVRTRTVQWYDTSRRLVASATLGTEHEYDLFVSAPPVFTRQGAPSYDPATGVVNRAGVPARAPLTISVYDTRGNLTHEVHPNGSVTHSEYSSLGRLIRRTENFGAPDAWNRRRTEHDYSIGRLTQVRTAKNGESLPLAWSRTAVTYGAPIVDDAFDIVSHNNALVGRLSPPDFAGDPADPSKFGFNVRYTFSGQVAERTDARGVTFRYRYDDLDRLRSVEIGHYPPGQPSYFSPGYPPELTPPSGAPADRVGLVEYTYDAAGRLTDIVARVSEEHGVLTHTRYTYDARGRLTADFQSLGEAVNSGPTPTPRTEYAWSYQPTSPAAGQPGHARLASTTYPQHPDAGPARVLTFTYGDPGSPDDRLGRVTDIHTTPGFGSVTNVASFAHAGLGRRIRTSLHAGAIVASLLAAPGSGQLGCSGLDGFGRVIDDHWRAGFTGQTLYRAQYTYDPSGQPLSIRLTQAASGGGTQDNVRSRLLGYDALERLTALKTGSLQFTAGIPSLPAPTRQDYWQTDALGNWSGLPVSAHPGVPASAGRWSTTDLTGQDVRSIAHDTDGGSRILQELRGGAGGPVSGPAYVYDKAGNVLSDGRHVFQYDAWNRLVQVSRIAAGTGQPGSMWHTVQPGALVKHFTYDGLGRLVRVQSPFLNPDQPLGVNRSERLYYDGVRRIQELVIDPVASKETAESDPSGQTPPGQEQQDTDPAAAPLDSEQQQINGNEDPSGGSGYAWIRTLAREYVWGPGDGSAGLDELLVHYAFDRAPYQVIQDASGDAAAQCFVNAGSAAVLEQYTLDPYGSAVTVEVFGPAPSLHAGHKGLFVERLDVGVSSGLGDPGDPARLAPLACTIVHARNRWLAPGQGRWLQADPNASALVLIGSGAHSGRELTALVASLDLSSLTGDGVNVYGYLGGNPMRRWDALGLFVGKAVDVYWQIGSVAGRIAHLLSSEYSANLEHDVSWAMDLSLPDDMHTRLDAQWVHHIYEAADVSGAVDNLLNPLDGVSDLIYAGVRFKGDYLKGSREILAIRQAGRVLKGAGHHAFFRFYTRYVKGAKEIVSHLPTHLHREYHTFVDRRIRELLKDIDCPSIWDPRGAKRWNAFLSDHRDALKRIIRAFETATAEFEQLKNIKGLSEAIRRAHP
ncbi:MAG: RHS repeat protein [Phycisphaeraceae bacterium]|nr:RHS repeat protein [Phycisphaeraceae bacterium]